MELSGAEILIQSLTDHNMDTVFGYPGACVMPILDNLFDNKDIRQILVRHEQGAVHAACGYAQFANKLGVVLVTSGPGATNTITGIADAFCSEIPLLIITGQVSSLLLGTDAFQEADMIRITASITKWNCQIRKTDEIADAVARAFKIATSGRPGPVLLDITKDAQTGRGEYKPICIAPNYGYSSINRSEASPGLPENRLYSEIIQILKSTAKEMVLVVDKVSNDFYSDEYFCCNKVLKSDIFHVPGFGLPTAIGAKHAVPDKTLCLIAGSFEFQATIKELGVIKQQGLDIKIIVLTNSAKGRFDIMNPNFMQFIRAYGINGKSMDRKGDLFGCIHEMMHSTGSYLLEINQ